MLTNGFIPGYAQYAKVSPHMCDDGKYPSDFQTPKTVELMRVLDSKFPMPAFGLLPPAGFIHLQHYRFHTPYEL